MKLLLPCILIGSVGLSGVARADVVSFSLHAAFLESIGPQGDPDNFNSFLFVNLFIPDYTNFRLTGFGYETRLYASDVSQFSDMAVGLGPVQGTTILNFEPGAGDSSSGFKDFSSNGLIDLKGQNLDFALGSEHRLYLEFFELKDDIDDLDGAWLNTTLTFQFDADPVPEPTPFIVVGVGIGFVALKRRAKR